MTLSDRVHRIFRRIAELAREYPFDSIEQLYSRLEADEEYRKQE